MPLIAGVALGDSTALFLSLVGLGTLLATSARWFNVVKVAGGLYLLYLGIKMLRAGASASAVAAPPARESMRRLFLNTYAVTALNPKGIVFFVAFLPQFIDPSSPAIPQLWALGITFVVLASTTATLYVTFVRERGDCWSHPERNADSTFSVARLSAAQAYGRSSPGVRRSEAVTPNPSLEWAATGVGPSAQTLGRISRAAD